MSVSIIPVIHNTDEMLCKQFGWSTMKTGWTPLCSGYVQTVSLPGISVPGMSTCKLNSLLRMIKCATLVGKMNVWNSNVLHSMWKMFLLKKELNQERFACSLILCEMKCVVHQNFLSFIALAIVNKSLLN